MLENKNKNLTKLEDFGEFNLIDLLTKDLKIRHKSTIKSIGDDAAVLDYKSKKVLVSTDFLVEGVHFDLSYMPLKHLGYKAVMVNLSDIYAMNGIAKHITVSIAISNRFTQEAMEAPKEQITEENIEDDVSNDLKEFGVDSDAPDLFSSETENSSPEDLLSSNNEEDDDLEIPAFLRRQKN